MPLLRVLTSPDGVWRAEWWSDGWRLYRYGGLVLDRASLDDVVAYMVAADARPEDLRED